MTWQLLTAALRPPYEEPSVLLSARYLSGVRRASAEQSSSDIDVGRPSAAARKRSRTYRLLHTFLRCTRSGTGKITIVSSLCKPRAYADLTAIPEQVLVPLKCSFWLVIRTVICIGSIPLRLGQHVHRHQKQSLDRPKVCIFKSRSRVAQALGAPEEELRTVRLTILKLLDDLVFFTAWHRCGHQKADGQDKMEKAKKSWLSRQWVLIAYVEFLCEGFSLENFNQAIGLSEVSINILGAVSTMSFGVTRERAQILELLCQSLDDRTRAQGVRRQSFELQLTFVKYDLTKTSAVLRSGSSVDVRVSEGRVNVASIRRCRLGSMVNWEGPATLSTIIRIYWRYDSVAESPRYTNQLGQ